MAKDAKLKSLFIMPAAALSGLLLIVSVVMILFASGHRLAWLGAAMASSPLPLLIGQLMWRPTARTGEYLLLHLLVMSIGLALACRWMYDDFVASWQVYQSIVAALAAAFNVSAGSAPGLVAIVAAVIVLLYVFWYSGFGRHHDARLDVGSKLPHFEVADLDGNRLTSEDFRGQPTVFLFYRGSWCPLCVAQIDELVQRYQDIDRLGIQVCLISSQHEAQSRALAERFDVPFKFLVDKDNKAAEALEIAVANGVPRGVPGEYPPDTAMPTLVVTSAGGTILFSDQTNNYRVRPEPDVFLAILRRAGAAQS